MAATVGRVSGHAYGQAVTGYEIHHGITRVEGGEPFLDGCRVGSVWGTTWHGVLENDDFRRAFLHEVAAVTASSYRPDPTTSFAQVRQRRFDVLADLVADHLDVAAVRALIEHGPPSGLPFIAPGAP